MQVNYLVVSIIFMILGLTKTSSILLSLKKPKSILKMSTVVHVRGRTKPTSQFLSETIRNARNSILEPGIRRFDVLTRLDSPEDFLLIEAYKSNEAPAEHKATQHYNVWRQAVESMMERPRESSKYTPIFPPPIAWDTNLAASHIPDVPLDKTAAMSILGGLNNTPSIVCIGDKKSYSSLLAVVVNIEVKPGSEVAFIEATIANCRASLHEPGVYRFDFLQDQTNPLKFCLVEVYSTTEAALAHKATLHYSSWASTVASMMAAPRSSIKYGTVFPAPLYWHK